MAVTAAIEVEAGLEARLEAGLGRVLMVVVCGAPRLWIRSVWRMCIASLRAVLAVRACCAICARARIAGVGMICSTVAHSAMLLALAFTSARFIGGVGCFCSLPGISGRSAIEGNCQDFLLRGGTAMLSRDLAALGAEWTGVTTGAIRCSRGASDCCLFAGKNRWNMAVLGASDFNHSFPNSHESARTPIAISTSTLPKVPSTVMKPCASA